MTAKDEITGLVRAINDCWLEGRYDDLRAHFHEDMVLVMPGFEDRVVGARPIIDSYRDFGEQGTIHSFEPAAPRVDVLGTAAITATPFAIDYTFDGSRYRETGMDLLVFVKDQDGWRVRWRTLVPKTTESA